MKKSIHPYAPFVPEKATKLIIGTIPPYRFCCGQELKESDVNFYYGSSDNYFWELVSKAVGKELEYSNSENAIQQRKDLLAELNIGITDIIQKCVHKNQKSDDKSLLDIEIKDIKQLLKQYPKIDTLIYTSEYVKTLMNHYVLNTKYHDSVNKNERKWKARIDDKEYKVIVLYSPSPNAIRGVTNETRNNQYVEVFKK